MHAALRLTRASLALGACFIFPAQAKSPKQGSVASSQAHYIATYFPGRMTRTPAEMLCADYLRQQFAQSGYQSDIRAFNSRYIYTTKDNHKSWHNVTGSTVIAAHAGKAPQQIVILAHLDTYAPHSDMETEKNLDGLTLQGIDDNADIPVLTDEAASTSQGKHSRAFPNATSAHDIRLDNQQHIDQALPGRIEQRTRDIIRMMLPLVKAREK